MAYSFCGVTKERLYYGRAWLNTNDEHSISQVKVLLRVANLSY
jgi:hypothetical protein